MSELPSRIRKFLAEHHTNVVGVLIVLVTIFGAYVTSQAASASGTGSDLDQRARQARILRSQIHSGIDSTVAYERGLFSSYERHIVLAGMLDERARAGGPRSGELKRRAEEERAVARALQAMFYAEPPVGARYTPAYSPSRARAFLEGQELELSELQPVELEDAAASARDKRYWLMAVDTALIGALFFLTVALLGSAFRPGFALAGVALAVLAVLGYAAVEILVEVPRS